MAWFKVLSHTPLVLNFQNGNVASFARGQVFEADPSLPDVRKYLRTSPPKIVATQASANGYAAPSTPQPNPGPQKPEPKPALPPGVSEIVKGPALRDKG